jgi:hypothetical protein
MTLHKDKLEVPPKDEHQLIRDGVFPLDLSKEFSDFCNACRRGDLKTCQELITTGVNINARDRFDYTPLILVSGPFRMRKYAPSKLTADFTRLACVGIMKSFSSFSNLELCASETLSRRGVSEGIGRL